MVPNAASVGGSHDGGAIMSTDEVGGSGVQCTLPRRRIADDYQMYGGRSRMLKACFARI